MAPVQTFSSSPISAAKAPAATQDSPSERSGPATAAVQPTSTAARYGPPPAQPGSRPSIPAATATMPPPSQPSAAVTTVYPQATPTQPIHDAGNPPPPQPGPLPTPPVASGATATATSTLPPPPKKGETLGPEHLSGNSSSNQQGGYPPPTTMPAQMSYPPPVASQSIRGTSTAATGPGFSSPYASAGPVQLPVGGIGGGINQATDMSHPPGYQQDAHATEFSSEQRAAHNAYVAQNSDFTTNFSGGAGGDGNGESIWNTAKKWAEAAGDKLAAAESEVWKAVNKDQK